MPTLINALVKFHNTFPGLEVIYSDNGTNFKGACREIKDAIAAWNRQQIKSHSQKVGSSSDMHGHASDLFAAAQGHVHANTYQCSREVS